MYFVFRSGHVYTGITSKVGSHGHSQFNIIAFQSKFMTSCYFVKVLQKSLNKTTQAKLILYKSLGTSYNIEPTIESFVSM